MSDPLFFIDLLNDLSIQYWISFNLIDFIIFKASSNWLFIDFDLSINDFIVSANHNDTSLEPIETSPYFKAIEKREI